MYPTAVVVSTHFLHFIIACEWKFSSNVADTATMTSERMFIIKTSNLSFKLGRTTPEWENCPHAVNKSYSKELCFVFFFLMKSLCECDITFNWLLLLCFLNYKILPMIECDGKVARSNFGETLTLQTCPKHKGASLKTSGNKFQI